MDVDLNEDNYDYSDLLQLFGLEPNFNSSDLKKAKKKVLRLHPDKSNIPKDYFLFFRKMYYKIEEIYNYTHHSINEEDFKRNIDIETHFKDYLEHKLEVEQCTYIWGRVALSRENVTDFALFLITGVYTIL